MTALFQHRETPSDMLIYRSSKKDRLNGKTWCKGSVGVIVINFMTDLINNCEKQKTNKKTACKLAPTLK